MPLLNVNKLRNIAVKLMNPRKVLNYTGSQISYALKLTRVPFYPPRLDIEPNNTCNLKCRHCQVTHWSKKAAYMDVSAFKSVLDQFPQLLSVKLQGMGEPFLNRNLIGMLHEGEKRGISMQLISNGTLLQSSFRERLSTLARTHISISLDGGTAETFEAIRVGASFADVVANIKGLISSRHGRSYPGISAATVLTTANVHELAEIVTMAKDLGVDCLNIQTSVTSWGKKEMEERAGPLRLDQSAQQVASALQRARQLGRQVGLYVHVRREDVYTRKRKCPWPWKSAFIAANGDVVPCCILADADVVKMGNVFEQKFSEIWNAKGYRDLRSRIKRHDLPDFCRNCYMD